MRIGGMSTDSAKRKKVWDEDIRVYSGIWLQARDIDEADENGMESATVHSSEVYEVDSGIPIYSPPYKPEFSDEDNKAIIDAHQCCQP